MTRPSTDYWASHLYLSPRQRPKPDQPVRDLPRPVKLSPKIRVFSTPELRDALAKLAAKGGA